MRTQFFDEDLLDDVTGGQITYTWDGNSGTLGINGRNPYILVDKAKFLAFYNENKDTMSEMNILKNLLQQRIIVKP